MATKISFTLLLVFIGNSISKGQECNQATFQLAIASFLQCVESHKVNIQDVDEMDIEKVCRTVPVMINDCLDKFKKPLENCKDPEIVNMLNKLEEAQKGPVNFLCYDNGRYLKELQENDGKKCNEDLLVSIQKNCQRIDPSSIKPTECGNALEVLNCVKRSFPASCKENVKRILYTTIKQNTMVVGCREYLMENDKTDLEIDLSSAPVMTKISFGLLITVLLALVLL